MSPNDSSPKKTPNSYCKDVLLVRMPFATPVLPGVRLLSSSAAPRFNARTAPPSSTDPVPASILCIHYHNLLEPGPVGNATGGTLLAPNSHQLQLFWHHILTNCHSFGIIFTQFQLFWHHFQTIATLFGIALSPIATFLASHSHQLKPFWHHILTNCHFFGITFKQFVLY